MCLEGSFLAENMLYAQQVLGTASDPMSSSRESRERNETPPGRLQFLTRPRDIERHLDNEDQIAEALAPQGFVALDAEKLSFAEQVQTFMDTRCVVLAHGAGVSNLVHRIGRPTGVVELFPADYARPYAAWLSRTFGFAYRAIVGTFMTPQGSFTVDEQEVAAAAREVLAEMGMQS